MRDRRRITTVVALCSLCFIINHLAAGQASQDIERKLSVVPEKASIFLEPSAASPVIGSVARKTVLTSYRIEGEWYRIMIPPDRDNVSLIGYIAAKDVTVVGEKPTGKPDYWGTGGKEYKGIGLEVMLGGGLSYFGGGDFADGLRGLFDEYAALISALGYSVINRDFRPFQSGVHFSADLAFRLSPRFSVGVSGEYLFARNFDGLGHMEDVYYQAAYLTPTLQTFIIRPGVYYTFPLGPTLSVRLDGGPALFVTSFEYNRNYSTASVDESYHLRGHDLAFGVQAGIGIELNLNERIGLFLRTTGRYARAANFTGDERLDRILNNGNASGPQYSGILYFLHRGSYPVLAVHLDSTSSDARSAVFDFTGLDLSLGLRIKI